MIYAKIVSKLGDLTLAGGVWVYSEIFVMIGLKADAGDSFKNRAPIPLAPCTVLYCIV